MDKSKLVKKNKKYIDIAKSYAELLMQYGYEIDGLHLFGSRIAGKPTKWSDLDVCVVSPSLKNNRFDESVKLTLLSRQISDLIEPHLMTPRDFADTGNILAREVRKKGIKVI